MSATDEFLEFYENRLDILKKNRDDIEEFVLKFATEDPQLLIKLDDLNKKIEEFNTSITNFKIKYNLQNDPTV